MLLTRNKINEQVCWAVDEIPFPNDLDLGSLLQLSQVEMITLLNSFKGEKQKGGQRLAPIDPYQEVWAAGVTYLRSRQARREESDSGNLYDLVYEADRPELFFKALGWRVVGDGMPIRVRADSNWNVPEPELVLVVNHRGEIIGYTAGNDVSSRDIEGENPLYLPQAKVYRGSCALGPGIQLCEAEKMIDLPIQLSIQRDSVTIYEETASTAALKRNLTELVDYLRRELNFPQGVFLMTGTCLVPGEDFSLKPGDRVRIRVGELWLENVVNGGS